MRRLSAARWLAALLIVLTVATVCQGQGLPRNADSVLAASSAAANFVKELNRAEQFKKQAAADPTKACNANDPDSLCSKQSTAADDRTLLLATSPISYDLRDPKQTGGIKVVTPVLDQLDCNTCTAFAVGAAAEIALSVGLRKPATSWFSPQDFFFCSSLQKGQERNCRSSWLIEPALAALVSSAPTTPNCLPYAPRSSTPCTYKCNTVNPDVPTGRFTSLRLTDEADIQQWVRTHGPVLTSMQLYPRHLFGFLAKNPSGIYTGPGPNTQEQSEGHAVLIVGYNNRQRFWVVRSSWGPQKGDDGYMNIAYGAVGIADRSETWGLRFKPLKPVAPYSPDQLTPATTKGCYNYKASAGDYFSRVADKFGVPVKLLVLGNLKPGQDVTAPLTGQTLLVCNSQEVANILPPTTEAEALLKVKAAIDPNNVLTSWVVRPDSKLMHTARGQASPAMMLATCSPCC